MTETEQALAHEREKVTVLQGRIAALTRERDEANEKLAQAEKDIRIAQDAHAKMRGLVDASTEMANRATAQAARYREERYREELESLTRHAEECQSMYHIDGQACIDAAHEVLAESPAVSLEAVREQAKEGLRREMRSSTYGELIKGCETLAHRIESHAWDNMPVWDQRDWLMEQAEVLHQQWCKKWGNTLDRESDRVTELQMALESDRINVIDGVNRLTKEIESRAWLMTGARGCYEWDDTRYQQEFHDAGTAILKALEPLRKIGADLSNCPADAKRSLEKMRADAKQQAIREWCAAIADEAMLSWLDNTPQPLPPRELLKRLLFAAGRERVVRELCKVEILLRSRAQTMANHGDLEISKAYDASADACKEAATRIEAEGRA